jgi:hypothetical protein
MQGAYKADTADLLVGIRKACEASFPLPSNCDYRCLYTDVECSKKCSVALNKQLECESSGESTEKRLELRKKHRNFLKCEDLYLAEKFKDAPWRNK